jgi:hypothetical protein
MDSQDLLSDGTYGVYRRHESRGETVDDDKEAERRHKQAWNAACTDARRKLRDRYPAEYARIRERHTGGNGWGRTMAALARTHRKEFRQLLGACKKAAGEADRCAQMPACPQHPELADALGHDYQGHVILGAVIREGITTPEQLARQGDDDLLGVRNLGPVRIAHLRARLAAREPGAAATPHQRAS